MMWLSEYLSPVAEGWVLTLFHSLWQGALIAGLVFLMLWMLNIRDPRIRYGAGIIGLVLFMLAVTATFIQVMPAAPQNEVVMLSQPTMTDMVTSRIASTEAGGTIISFIRENMPVLLKIWAVGAILLLFRMVGGYQYVRRIVRRGEDNVPEAWQQMLTRIADRMQITRSIRVLNTAHADMPMVFGHVKPVLLLPVSLLSGMSADQLEAIFAHELAHIRRHDFLVNIGQQVLEALFFFNPFVWVLSGHLRTEREKCCDDLAMAICHNERQYVEALSTLELYRSELPSGAMTLLGKKGELLARIRRLTDPAYGETGSSKWVVMIALSATFFLASYMTQSSDRPDLNDDAPQIDALASAAMPAYFSQSPDTVAPVTDEEREAKKRHTSVYRVTEDTTIRENGGAYRFYASPDSDVQVYVRSGSKDTIITGPGGELHDFTFVMPDLPEVDFDFDVNTWTNNNQNGFTYVFLNDTLPGYRVHMNDSLLSEEDREALERAREEMQRARELMQEEQERMQEIMEKYREEYPEAMEEYRRAMREVQREMRQVQREMEGRRVEVIVEDRPEVIELQRVLRDQERLTDEQMRKVEIQVREAQRELERARPHLRGNAVTVRPYMDRDRMNGFQAQVEEMLRADDYLNSDDELKKIELTEDYFKYNGKKVKGGDFSRYLRAYESRFGKLDGSISMKLD